MVYYKTDSPTLRIPDYTIAFDSLEEYQDYMSKIYDENGVVRLQEGFTDADYLNFIHEIFGIK